MEVLYHIRYIRIYKAKIKGGSLTKPLIFPYEAGPLKMGIRFSEATS